MAETVVTGNKVLLKMLDRLYNALSNGSTLNCRPYSSRSRIDMTEMEHFNYKSTSVILSEILGTDKQSKVLAKLTPPPEKPQEKTEVDIIWKNQKEAYDNQIRVLKRMRTIAEDAREFEQDTGIRSMYIGYPLLSLPSAKANRIGTLQSGKVLAPICFIPVELSVSTGINPGVEIKCCERGSDRLIPNRSLIAWMERQTGKMLELPDDDESGEETLKEMNELILLVARQLNIPPITITNEISIVSTPKTEELENSEIIPSAVLGLFPLSNQSILRDMQEMCVDENLKGPIESFLKADVSLHRDMPPSPTEFSGKKDIHSERFIAIADPCQSRAASLARTSPCTVIHGPPGTGKSQTIANIIGDHLSRGQRVLMVCDKRTAIDVVYNRLEHLGLGELCAVVHDATYDRKNLYLKVREQIEKLAETPVDNAASSFLMEVDDELSRVHNQFLGYIEILNKRPTPAQFSFSELAGLWFSTYGDGIDEAILPVENFGKTSLEEARKHEHVYREALERALKCNYSDSRWKDATEIDLQNFINIPFKTIISNMNGCLDASEELDSSIVEGILPFDPDIDIQTQVSARSCICECFEYLKNGNIINRALYWSKKDQNSLKQTFNMIQGLTSERTLLKNNVPDRELILVSKNLNNNFQQIKQFIQQLEEYKKSLMNWYGFLQFRSRNEGRKVLSLFGLSFDLSSVERLLSHLQFLKNNLILGDFCINSLYILDSEKEGINDFEKVLNIVEENEKAIETVNEMLKPGLSYISNIINEALLSLDNLNVIIDRLKSSCIHADFISDFEKKLDEFAIFSNKYRGEMKKLARTGEKTFHIVSDLHKTVNSIEEIIRIRNIVLSLPEELSKSLNKRLLMGCNPQAGWSSLLHRITFYEMNQRISLEPELMGIDGEHLDLCQKRYLELMEKKHFIVINYIRQKWLSVQKDRLLAKTGNRLNNLGADLKRRLLVKGNNALKLRQVIAAGSQTEESDPLFDLRPVWMSSPDCVAQIFPRETLFDIIIFDEASQCRLEEALPVLTRGKRVIIAGDPKQLPPSRFFETAVVESGNADAETEQDLFEYQQSEVEDILAGALNLDIDQAYLDVHYRSRCSGLIEFSNQSFYESRLQAIPGHPRNLAMLPPIRLIQVNGIYSKRANRNEADEVVKILKELLKRSEPPSIGVACFNLTQREMILDVIDSNINSDPEFASRMMEARNRKGRDSFEGLFVKNLENVQGDERDVIIISTTFGPDPNGKFYRRFGPLGMSGGGRRLNVLVTRARQEIILVTSIPSVIYKSSKNPPEGKQPNGAWYLFAYLQYAEFLQKTFEEAWAKRKDAMVAEKGIIRIGESSYPHKFSEALALYLAENHKISSDVYWGSDGFCIDLALLHPSVPNDVTIGILCDATRFKKAPDLAEWDAFRTLVLSSQGWDIFRLWSPHFIRNPEKELKRMFQSIENSIKQNNK